MGYKLLVFKKEKFIYFSLIHYFLCQLFYDFWFKCLLNNPYFLMIRVHSSVMSMWQCLFYLKKNSFVKFRVYARITLIWAQAHKHIFPHPLQFPLHTKQIPFHKENFKNPLTYLRSKKVRKSSQKNSFYCAAI